MANHEEAVDFLRLVQDADSTNRAEALADLRFSHGEQWPAEIQQSRTLEGRPCLTINKLDAYIRKICNQQRKQRPRGKAHPVNDTSDPKIAEIITGIGRHIEVNSNADNAYDTAFESAVRMGWGYWRIRTDYIREDSFDQSIYIDQVDNPFTVYFDPYSTLLDGSDAERCLITDVLKKEAFLKQYPGASLDGFKERASGDQLSEWVDKDGIRIAEYFYTERTKAKLLMLSDKSIVWADKLPPMGVLEQAGIQVVGERESYRKYVRWCKVTAFETLEEKDWPGRWIPVVPVYGVQLTLEGRRKKFGLTRVAKDPQSMFNFWRTAMTEKIALAPKAKWLLAEGQDEGHENEFAQANVTAKSVLRYKPTDVEGKPAPPPQYIQPEGPPAGAMSLAASFSEDLGATIGVYDPSQDIENRGQKSGKAILAERSQSDDSNFHFYDNLTGSIQFTWRQILDLIPQTFDKQRVMRIIGDDDKPDLVTINEKKDEAGVSKILNDVTVGDYDVVMETGPGFDTKRLEFVEVMANMLSGNKELWSQAGDLLFRNMDFAGADIIADRLAAANPLAQIDDKSDIPPRAQMMMAQMKKQLDQAHQLLQQAGMEIKFKQGIEQSKQEAEIKREQIRAEVKMHDTSMMAATRQHDVETRAFTAQNVEEIRGIVALLVKHIDTAQLEKELASRDKELTAKADESAATVQ